MTIRLTDDTTRLEILPGTRDGVKEGFRVQARHTISPSPLARCEAEAEQARRAFELVLAPRFTRDEAIVAVQRFAEERGVHSPEFTQHSARDIRAHYIRGLRHALEALAAAGVFSDEQPQPAATRNDRTLEKIQRRTGTVDARFLPWPGETMADKLDAAGIR